MVFVFPNRPPPVVVELPKSPPPVVFGAAVVDPKRPPDGADWVLVVVLGFPKREPPVFVPVVLPKRPPPVVPVLVLVLPKSPPDVPAAG